MTNLDTGVNDDDTAGHGFLPPRVGDRLAVIDRQFIQGRVAGDIVALDGVTAEVQWDHLPGHLARVDWTRNDIVWGIR